MRSTRRAKKEKPASRTGGALPVVLLDPVVDFVVEVVPDVVVEVVPDVVVDDVPGVVVVVGLTLPPVSPTPRPLRSD